MGTDISIFAEKKNDQGAFIALDFAPFDNRSYGVFGFLAGVRNYSGVPPISPPRGAPEGSSMSMEYWGDHHSHSWLSVQELAAFDYNAMVEDRRVTINNSGGCTCAPGEGKTMTWREFLGEGFMEDLAELVRLGADRIVFCFDC